MNRGKASPPIARSWLDDHDDRLLDSREAGQFLSFSADHMRKMRCSNAGPPWIVLPNGYSIRYRLGDLKAWAGIGAKAAA